MAVFNEDTRVKIPATIQFLRLDYNYQSLKADDIDIDFNTKIFVNRFKPALEIINRRKFTYDEIKSIITDIHNILKNNDLGKEFYHWLINPEDRVKLIDFEDITPAVKYRRFYLLKFPSAALSSIVVALATTHSSALQMKIYSS